jgi:hypothetical protein
MSQALKVNGQGEGVDMFLSDFQQRFFNLCLLYPSLGRLIETGK